MVARTLTLAPENPKHKKIIDMLIPRVNAAESANTEQGKKWRQAENTVLAYVPESDLDAKRRARRENGNPAYTTIQLPYTYALLMSAHTYWTSVFFARTPVHQYSGRHGETERQTQAMEALIDYQVQQGEMLAPYYIWLYDAGKYGIGVLGTYWDKRTTRFSDIVAGEGGKLNLVTKQLETYQGNTVYNVSPFDFLPDPRVAVGQFQKGEFLAIRKRISWSDILRRKALGYYTNVDKIKTQYGTMDGREMQQSQLSRPGTVTIPGGDDKTSHPFIVEGFEVYVELVPKEWGLGNNDFPEKWVFTVTKDFSLLLGIQPLSYIHGKFPFDVIETEVEAYGQWNRGIPEIMEPVQNTMDWLINSHFFNVRASLNNLFLADPTKIMMKDFETTEPGGFIRLRPEAYGMDIDKFFKQLQVNDVTLQHLGDLQVMQAVGERVLGINDQIMGAITGGGRKTATEIRTSTGFGTNRLKTITEYMSATSFAPHSQKLVQHSQQFYDADKKFRIVGDLVQEAGAKFLQVNPEMLAGYYDFVNVDGSLPVDRYAQANLWKELIAQMSRVPQVLGTYDLGRIFGWVASLAGLKNVQQFKLQIMPPGMVPPGSVPINAQGPGAPPQPDPRTTGIVSSETGGAGIGLE